MGMRQNVMPVAFSIVLGGTVLLSGCGTPQSAKVAPDIASAKTAVGLAADSESAKYAPNEMQSARENLQGAQYAIDNKEYDKARKLADKALVEARLANEKARAGKAKAQAQTLKETVETLKSELDRMSKQ
ncbi:MAG: DUF4398 domain-containing protein [Pseudomonadota bacterium]